MFKNLHFKSPFIFLFWWCGIHIENKQNLNHRRFPFQHNRRRKTPNKPAGERSVRFCYERISWVVSLAITWVSLVISLVALSIAQKTYVYSSKDYTPAIDYFIDEWENLIVTNQSSDLFKIQMIRYITFKQIGYEDYRRDVVVQIPFITRSILYPWVDMDNNPEKSRLNLN